MMKLIAISIVLIHVSSTAAADSTRRRATIDTFTGRAADLGCACADHPKPGYDCTNCSFSPGECQCSYELKIYDCPASVCDRFDRGP
jgi:hypothetical protein